MAQPEYKIIVSDSDDQIEVVLRAPNGDKWEYGVPFNRETGRFDFEDIKVIELDFGSDFADQMISDIRKAVKAAIAEGK
ncbi:MAG: hypothetical protein HY286_11140 [Planctomycetes bacterium]|nr:hypothetical protein [Planctomycetota bacterium]